MGIELRGGTETIPASEWGFMFHMERSDGTLIDEFIFFDDYVTTTARNLTYTGYGSIPPIALPAGTNITLRLFFRRTSVAGTQLSDNLRYRIVAPAEDDDRIVIRKYTQAGHPSGTKGDSQVAIFTRSATTPTAPTAIGKSGAILTGLGSWRQNGPPSGNDPIWIQWLEINNSTNPATVIVVGTPFELPRGPTGNTGSTGPTGPRGPPGEKGISIDVIYRHSTNTITRTPTGGTATDGELTAAPTDWQLTYPGADDVVWISIAHIDGSTITYSRPQRFSGPQGPAGNTTPSLTYYYLRTSAFTEPTRPTTITYNGSSFGNIGSWVPFESATGDRVANPYLWAVPIQYRIGINNSQQVGLVQFLGGVPGQRGPAGAPSTVPGPAGATGTSYQQFYIANTADSVTRPNIDYNGTTFSNLQGWAATVPTTPVGANIFTMPVRYVSGTANSEVEEGVILSGTVPGTVTPPPSGAQSYPFTYGIAVRGTHAAQPQVFDAQNPQPTLSLTAGQSGDYNVIITNSTTHLDFYFDLPTGLTIVAVYDTGIGVNLDTSDWTADDAANPRRYFYDGAPRGDAQYHLRVTVRRP